MAEDDPNTSDVEANKLGTEGEYVTTLPLPVYSSDSDDSYETDSETDLVASSLPQLGHTYQVPTGRPRIPSMDSMMSLPAEYEYETEDSDEASIQLQPPQHPGTDDAELLPSPTGRGRRLSFDSHVSIATIEYETDSDASQSPDHPFEPETMRSPQDPDAKDAANPPPPSDSIEIERQDDQLTMVNEWKASSTERLTLELKQKSAEIQNHEMAQEDLWLRLRQLESEKAESSNTIGNLMCKVAEFQQLVVNEQAAHQQTKDEAKGLYDRMANLSRDSSPSTSSRNRDDDIAALQDLVKQKDFIIQNALAEQPASESKKVAELEQEIQEAHEIIDGLNQLKSTWETTHIPMQEKDAEIGALRTKNQELLLSQNALKQKSESMDAILARKEALLKRKDEEICSLKEVIRKKDVSLQTQAANFAERVEVQAADGEKKPEAAGEDPKPELATAPSEQESNSVEKEDESSYQGSKPESGDKVLDVPQTETETVSSQSPSGYDCRQRQLEYDLDEELDSLRTKVHSTMKEAALLTDVMDRKDAALKDATKRLEKLQAENAMLKRTTSSVDGVPVATMEDCLSDETSTLPESLLHGKLLEAQQSIAAKTLIIASLQAELGVEKLRREELEQSANENDSSSSVSISDVDSESQGGNQSGSSALEGASASKRSKSSTAKNSKAKREFDEDSLVGEVGIRVFGQEQKLDVELEKEMALESQKEATHEEQFQGDPSLSTFPMMEVAEEISELKHSIFKRDEAIKGLRAKLQEHEALISLLNKALSGKDTKIDRLERLIGQSHRNVNISKELEENEMTIDSLVLYRFEKEQQMGEMQDKIQDLEHQVRASKETEYQLRRRTDELSGAETKIRRLKAELKTETQRMTHLMEENSEKLAHAKEEKIRLEYDIEAQSQKLNDQLGEKDDFIKSIHSEAAERGLIIDSLEASLQDTNMQLQRMESKANQQASDVAKLTAKLRQLTQEKKQWIADEKDKDELIQMLNESRLEGQRIIADLTKPRPETSRQKMLRRYHKLQAVEGASGLEAYMEPYVLDIHQAQTQYETARKNLRLAEARERLIRPRGV
ncbi:MAG: hypothetical protein SGBAC_007831 [Bacillariaceae sp.]